MASKKDRRETDKARKQRLARMRRYYKQNKTRWRNYKAKQLSELSEAEREKRRQKSREYSRRHYLANREAILARTRKYRLSDVTGWAAYQAAWYQQNKSAVATRRRRHYHAVVKPRRQAAKAAAAYLTVSRAAMLLGAKLSVFRQWVYDGRIEAIRTPGGRYLLSRETVEHIRDESHHYPTNIKERLGLGKAGGVK